MPRIYSVFLQMMFLGLARKQRSANDTTQMLQTTATAASAASAIKGGRRPPQPAAPIGAGRRRKAGNAEKPAAPKSRKCRTAGRGRMAASNGRRRRMTGRNRMTGRGPRTDMVVAPDKGPRRDDGPWTDKIKGHAGQQAADGKPAAPKSRKRTDGWSRRTAGCDRRPVVPGRWPRTGYRKSINS